MTARWVAVFVGSGVAALAGQSSATALKVSVRATRATESPPGGI
ncbi:hypothetical protein FHX42_004585 [Saccharopolyspora lacisalsi]|uniref:Uncharacterized protein n=1 Tax=Halosaccharopolyspora lacisalsi TaxID=1000566 RepID=A0A839E7D9_9PSEU|nr:hypothetical protein [Halosaccharopolyspora lacisalsi]